MFTFRASQSNWPPAGSARDFRRPSIQPARISCILLIFLALITAPRADAMKDLKLIPQPREYRVLEGQVKLSDDWKIHLAADASDCKGAAEGLSREALDCFGARLVLAPSDPLANVIRIQSCPLSAGDSELFGEQGYYLSIEPGKIAIKAPADAGRFYGIQTLRQIFQNCADGSLPCLAIKDWPSLRWRGVSDDISRGQVSTLRDFKCILRELAYFKINLYQPYIEDMFAFDADPRIGRKRGALGKEELAAIRSEAERQHILITPVFECLGHQDRLLSLPGNRQYAEVQDPGRKVWSFSPVNEEAYVFVTQLIGEMAGAFPSPFFHIGGDESFDVGKGTSAQRVKEIGVGRVHAEYFTRLSQFVSKRLNRRTMVYADMILNHPEAMASMPKDCVMVDWQYDPANTDFPTIRKLKDAGFKDIMISSGIWSWATYYPNYSMGFTNIANCTAMARKEGLLGCIASSWGDGGAENLRRNNVLAYAYSAAASWEAQAPERDRFLSSFAALYLGNDSGDMIAALRDIGWFDYLKERYIGRAFHHSPRIKALPSERIERFQTLSDKMRETHTLLGRLRASTRRNQEWLDVLDHVAKRNLYLAQREQALDRIARLLENRKSGELPSFRQKEILRDLESLRTDLAGLAGEFQSLWLRWYKYPALDFNMQRLGNQLAALQDFITLAETGRLTAEKTPAAVWFWYPEPKPKEDTIPVTRYFMREVNLDKEPVEASLKCWADEKAAVFVNGEKVFEVSYYDNEAMIYNPPKEQSVKNLFRKGNNRIAIEAENMFGQAGILLEIRITFAGHTTLTLTGDEEWKSSDHAGAGWTTGEMKGPGVQPVKLLGKGLVEPWDFIEW